MRRPITHLLQLAAALVLLGVVGSVWAQSGPDPEAPLVSAQADLGTAITYQGRLSGSGGAVSAACGMAFRLYNAASGGSQVGSAITATVPVSNGLFSTALDFGAGAFTGPARWLGVAVQCPSDPGFTDLGRQALTAAPYALYAASALSATTALTATTAGTAANASALNGQAASAYQARVTGACSVGSFVRSINADGSVVCGQDAVVSRLAPAANVSGTVDSSGDVGQYASVTIGSDGLPVMSYFDAANGDLKVIRCGTQPCAAGNFGVSISSSDSIGLHTSIALGADGLPIVAYFDSTNGDLKVLRCGDVYCASGNTSTTVESTGVVGQYPSITIGSDGLPMLSYYDATNGDLKLKHCGNSACSGGNITVAIASADDIGQFTSITVGADGLPLVSYYDATNKDLKVLRCGAVSCFGGNTSTTVDFTGTVGYSSSITIGADGLGVVSYFDATNGDLKVLHCGTLTCTTGNGITTVDSAGLVGEHASLTIGTDGLPVLSYYDSTNGNLKVLHCGNVACSGGNSAVTVDSVGDVGLHTAITLGPDGLPVVAYYDATNKDLKVLTCANPLCVPYWRRR